MNIQKENFTLECSSVPKIRDIKDAVTLSSQVCFVIQNNAETTAKFNNTLNQENLEYHNEKANMGVNTLVPFSGVLRFVGWKDKLKPSENVEWYKCVLCDLKTEYKDVFLRHFKIIHEEKRFFYCNFCKYKSKNERDLQAHIELKHNENTVKQYNCPNCDLKTIYKDVYLRHFKIIHEKKEKSFECIFCKYKSKFKSRLQLHIKRKHSAKLKKIEQVTAKLDDSQNRVMTDVINSEENIMKVNVNSDDVRTEHQEIEVAEDVKIDVQKGIKFSKVLEIEHKKEMVSTLSLSNKVCFEIQNNEEMTTGLNDILNQENCKTQEYNVTDVVEFEEDVTAKVLSSDNTEMNIGDNNTGAYSDNSKSLVSKDNLDPSENVVWYECNLCELRIKDKDIFSRHLEIIHAEQEFFHCEFCEYKSKNKHSLQAHIDLKHESAIKLYNCPNCELKTNYKDVFLRHFEIVHVEKETLFQCVFCEYKSIFKGHLKSHVRQKHSAEQKKDTQNQVVTNVIKHDENVIKDNVNSDDVKREIEDNNIVVYNENLRSGVFRNDPEPSEGVAYEYKLCELKTEYQETEVTEDTEIDIKEEIDCSEVLKIKVKEDVTSTSSSLDKVCFDIQNNEQMITSFKNILNPENYGNDREYNAIDEITCEENVTVKNLYHDDTQMDIREDDIDAYSEDSKSVASEDNIESSENVSWFICALCELKTKYMDVFLRHFKIIHEENKLFHCKFCKYKSKDKYSLQAHINSTHNESTIKSYKCPYCDLKTNYRYVLLQHFEIIHKKKAKLFQCAFCEYKSKFKGHLQIHVDKKHKKVEQATARPDDFHDRIVHDNNLTSYNLKLEENVIKDYVNYDDVKRGVEDSDIVIYNENLRSAAFKSDPEPCEDIKYEYKLCELETKYQETEVAEDIQIDIKEEIECSEVLKIEVKEEEARTSCSLGKVQFDIKNKHQF